MKYLVFKLAKTLHKTKYEIESSLSYRELIEWQAFFEYESDLEQQAIKKAKKGR